MNVPPPHGGSAPFTVVRFSIHEQLVTSGEAHAHNTFPCVDGVCSWAMGEERAQWAAAVFGWSMCGFRVMVFEFSVEMICGLRWMWKFFGEGQAQLKENEKCLDSGKDFQWVLLEFFFLVN